MATTPSNSQRQGGHDAGRAAPAPSFSVVVPCHDGARYLVRVLDALVALTPAPVEIIVVDDASSDDSAEICARYPVQLVSFPHKRGVASARNAGASRATGDVVVFIDADVVVPRDLIARLAAFFQSEQEIVAASALLDPDFSEGGFFSEFLNRRMHHGFSHLREGVTTLLTSCAAVRRDAFDRVGGFDEAGTRAVNDEATLGWRLADLGLDAAILDDLLVQHLKVMTLGSWCRKFWDEGRQWVLLARRHRHESRTGTLMLLQLRRPLNVALVVLGVPALAAAPLAPLPALGLASAAATGFLVLNGGYLRDLGRDRSAAWRLGAAGMVLLEACLHAGGMAHGLLNPGAGG